MLTALAPIRWQRIALAAAKLAAIYAIGVIILAFALTPLVGALPRTLEDLIGIVIPFAVVFSLAFIVLAVARRAGLLFLWLLISALWAWMLRSTPGYAATLIPMRFIGWTVLAAPLYTLSVLGVPSLLRVPVLRWRAPLAWLVWIVWVALLAPAIHYSSIAPDVFPLPAQLRLVLTAGPLIWGPAPFIIAGSELVRLWVAMDQGDHATAAA